MFFQLLRIYGAVVHTWATRWRCCATLSFLDKRGRGLRQFFFPGGQESTFLFIVNPTPFFFWHLCYILQEWLLDTCSFIHAVQKVNSANYKHGGGDAGGAAEQEAPQREKGSAGLAHSPKHSSLLVQFVFNVFI